MWDSIYYYWNIKVLTGFIILALFLIVMLGLYVIALIADKYNAFKIRKR